MAIELSMAKSQLDDVQAELNKIALTIPNIPADEVPLVKTTAKIKRFYAGGAKSF